MTIEGTAADTARETIRIPANIMEMLRQSYDTREKMLDWCLAIGVTVVMVWAFRDQICAALGINDDSPNAGRDDEAVPNQDVADAFPLKGTGADVYTYNMPRSRTIRYSIGPSLTRMPKNPSTQGQYP